MSVWNNNTPGFAVFGQREHIAHLETLGWELIDRNDDERVPWFARVGGDAILVDVVSAITTTAASLTIAESLLSLGDRIKGPITNKIWCRIGYLNGARYESIEINGELSVEDILKIIEALRPPTITLDHQSCLKDADH